MNVPTLAAGLAADVVKSRTSTLPSTDPRSRTPTRRVEIQGLTPDGTLKDITGLAPARPIFEDAFSALSHGSLLSTPQGPIAVEDIWPGDLVDTVDHGPLPLLWKGCMTLNPRQPSQAALTSPLTRLQADSLGISRPSRDLILGPSARLVYRSGDLQATIGHDKALISAAEQQDGEQAIGMNPISPVRVFHIAFEKHALVLVNGVEVESFHPGPQVGQVLYAHGLQLYLSFFPHVTRLRDFGPLSYPRLTSEELESLRRD
ncbi:MAG: Hint domain-containing protein [Pseudomonadota bacterium]